MKRLIILLVTMQLLHPSEGLRAQQTTAAEPNTAEQQDDQGVMTIAQLSWSLRSQLPEFSVIGWRSNEDDSKRFARINGEVFVEGDELEGGLMLLQINKTNLVFMFKGTRFRYTP